MNWTRLVSATLASKLMKALLLENICRGSKETTLKTVSISTSLHQITRERERNEREGETERERERRCTVLWPLIGDKSVKTKSCDWMRRQGSSDIMKHRQYKRKGQMR